MDFPAFNPNDPDQKMDLDMDKYLTENPDGTKTLRLQYPFTVGVKTGDQDWQDESVDQLNYRRPKAGDLDLLEKFSDSNVFKPTRDFLGLLTGIPPETIKKELDADDFFRAMEVAFNFLPQPKKKTKNPPMISDGSLPAGETTPES